MKQGLLDKVAEQHHTFISSLRILPHLKWAALRDLHRMENKEQYPLSEMSQAVGDIYNTGDGINNMDALQIQRILANVE